MSFTSSNFPLNAKLDTVSRVDMDENAEMAAVIIDDDRLALFAVSHDDTADTFVARRRTAPGASSWQRFATLQFEDGDDSVRLKARKTCQDEISHSRAVSVTRQRCQTCVA
jgi:hypothetical protein